MENLIILLENALPPTAYLKEAVSRPVWIAKLLCSGGLLSVGVGVVSSSDHHFITIRVVEFTNHSISQKELSTGEPDCRLFTFFSRLAQAGKKCKQTAVWFSCT